MGIAEEIGRLADTAGDIGNAELRRELLRLCQKGAELERLLAGREREIAELRHELEVERTMRAPKPQSVLGMRCPNWKDLLHRIVGWGAG